MDQKPGWLGGPGVGEGVDSGPTVGEEDDVAKVQAIMKSRDLSQTQAALEAGVLRAYLGYWLSRKPGRIC